MSIPEMKWLGVTFILQPYPRKIFEMAVYNDEKRVFMDVNGKTSPDELTKEDKDIFIALARMTPAVKEKIDEINSEKKVVEEIKGETQPCAYCTAILPKGAVACMYCGRNL